VLSELLYVGAVHRYETGMRGFNPQFEGLVSVFSASIGASGEGSGFDDGAEDAAAAESDVMRSRFYVENQEAAFIPRETRRRVHESARRDGFEVIDLDSRANRNGAFG
jgi:hypothetical protein